MSYADIAAKGPKQTDEEKMPPYVPEIAHPDSSVHSLDSLSTDRGVHSINSSYADQQLAEERAAEAREEARAAADKTTEQAKQFMARAEKDAKRLAGEAESGAKKFEKEAAAKYEQVRGEASKEFSEVKKQAGIEKERASKAARKAEDWAEKNKGNPVVIGNAVVITALTGLLGVGAYRLHKTNSLTWNVIGAWAGAVGVFAVGDYFVSQYFFKKYPPKN